MRVYSDIKCKDPKHTSQAKQYLHIFTQHIYIVDLYDSRKKSCAVVLKNTSKT